MSAASPLAINRMLALLQGHGKRLDTLERYAASARFIDYTPALQASVTNPTLGSNSLVGGRYVRIGNWVYATGDIRFGTAGAAAGSGTYYITLPVDRTSVVTANSDMYAGHWRCVGPAPAPIPYLNTHDIIISPGLGLGRMQSRYPATYPTGTDTQVTHAVPWTWTINCRISFWVMYEAEE